MRNNKYSSTSGKAVKNGQEFEEFFIKFLESLGYHLITEEIFFKNYDIIKTDKRLKNIKWYIKQPEAQIYPDNIVNGFGNYHNKRRVRGKDDFLLIIPRNGKYFYQRIELKCQHNLNGDVTINSMLGKIDDLFFEDEFLFICNGEFYINKAGIDGIARINDRIAKAEKEYRFMLFDDIIDQNYLG